MLRKTEEIITVLGPFKRGENVDGTNFHERFRPELFSAYGASLFVLLWIVIFIVGLYGGWK